MPTALVLPHSEGATHKSLAPKADGKSTVLTDFVKVGDTVTVVYHDVGSMKHARSITTRNDLQTCILKRSVSGPPAVVPGSRAVRDTRVTPEIVGRIGLTFR